MSVRLRMKDTAPPGLCGSCRYARYNVTEDNERRVECKVFGADMQVYVIRKPVVECSEHQPSGGQDLWFMQQIAWTIETKKNQGFAGFLSPDDRRKNGDFDVI